MAVARFQTFCLPILAVLLCAAAYGQLSTSSITGSVRDATGSVIPEATVSLRNVDTAVQRQTVTNLAGNYVFLNIQPGRYTLEASRSGFNKSSIAPFTLEVNQTATFDFSLSVGGVEQSVPSRRSPATSKPRRRKWVLWSAASRLSISRSTAGTSHSS